MSNAAHIFRSARIATCLLGLSVAGTGCDASEGLPRDPDAQTETIETTRGIHGVRLHAQRLGTDHIIEFYELARGETAIRESKSVDDDRPTFLERNRPFKSLADVYAKLNPTARSVPVAIMEADQNAKLNRMSAAEDHDTSSLPAQEEAALPTSAAQGCSGDQLGDNWGARWFLDNFCNAGNFRDCHTNWGSGQSGWNEVSHPWHSWRQMEGDFNLPGHITGYYIWCKWYGCGTRNIAFDYDVLPRHV